MHGFHRSGSRSGGRGWDGLSQLWPSAQLTIDPTQERGSEGGGLPIEEEEMESIIEKGDELEGRGGKDGSKGQIED